MTEFLVRGRNRDRNRIPGVFIDFESDSDSDADQLKERTDNLRSIPHFRMLSDRLLR